MADFRWLAAGFLLTLCSGFGQTYFIAIFAGFLKSELTMTDGQFGTYYMIATLSSAALLMWAGKFADTFSIRWLGVGVLTGLAVTSLAMSLVRLSWMLVIVLLGLRFFAQGMLGHVSMTAMGRWFERRRGRAISIAALGYPVSEAVLPMIAVGVIALVGWRWAWVVIAGSLVVVPIPLLIGLLNRPRVPLAGSDSGSEVKKPTKQRQWTRGEVMRSPLFYLLMPGVLGPPFILTGIFFYQVTIVELKQWQLSWFAASFAMLAVVSVPSALLAGWLVDRFGARRLLPLFLIPLGVAILILTYGTSPYILPLFMALVGLALGSASTVQGALWPELYGVAHLGAIRSLATAAMVFATALSPALIGILLDAGVPLEHQLLAMAVYCLLASIWMGALMTRLDRLAVDS